MLSPMGLCVANYSESLYKYNSNPLAHEMESRMREKKFKATAGRYSYYRIENE